MEKFIIHQSKDLSGEINVNGAKNLAIKLIPASILAEDEIKLNNLPLIEDVNKSLSLLKDLGAKVELNGKTALIDTSLINKTKLSEEVAKKFRASIMFVGPLLARFGEVEFPHPGGCVIGAGGRPIDLFLDGFKNMGAEVKVKEGYYKISARELRGCHFFFPKISVTATESLIMTASMAEGETVLHNCAMEPEISALAKCLNECGAQIEGAGTPTIKIKGRNKLPGGGEWDIIPDRIETGSFAIMAAVTGSELTITNCDPDHIKILLDIFKRIGVDYKAGKDHLIIKKTKKIKPYSIQTHEYPGFPTDLQPPYTLLMTQAEGSSLVHEVIYDRRLLFTDLLAQMGADIIMCDPHRIVVNGPSKLYGRQLTSPDLRAGITLVIAAICAEGKTEISNIYQIERGYKDIEKRLRKIGVDIKKTNNG
jgi:UDP-N-acetylglucosamine 1-carboxyvinyltransferase